MLKNFIGLLKKTITNVDVHQENCQTQKRLTHEKPKSEDVRHPYTILSYVVT